MGQITEDNRWVTGIYQFEVGDAVLGGEPDETTGAGKSNIPIKQLADRTTHLKFNVDEMMAFQVRMAAEWIEIHEDMNAYVLRMAELEDELTTARSWVKDAADRLTIDNTET